MREKEGVEGKDVNEFVEEEVHLRTNRSRVLDSSMVEVPDDWDFEHNHSRGNGRNAQHNQE